MPLRWRSISVKVLRWPCQLIAIGFWSSLLTEMGEKRDCRSIAKNQVTGDVLICSNNETTCVMAPTAGCTTWLSLHSFALILQDPLVFCIGQIGELNRDIRRHHPCIFEISSGGSNLCIPSGKPILLLFTIFLGRVVLVAFTWPFLS